MVFSLVSTLTRDIDIAILSVCLSVRPSVRDTLVLYENGLTYRHIFYHVIAKSLWFYHHQTSSRNSNGVTPCGGAKQRWGMKISQFSTNNLLYLRNGWMGICSEAFYKHWILFPTVWHSSRLSQGRTQGRPKCAKNVRKWRTFELTGWITGKRLKIDGYMLRMRCVWQALNPLSIHVTFTAIVTGAYPGEAKMCLRLSWRS